MSKRKTKVQKKNTIIGILIALLLVVSIGGAFMFSVGGDKAGDDSTKVSTGDCNTAPSLSDSIRNSFDVSSSVTVGKQYLVNGEYYDTAPSTFAKGDKVQVLYNASSYIDMISQEIVLECGANSLINDIMPYQAPTIEIKEDNTVLSDSTAGSNNASSIASGGSNTVDIFFTGHDKKTTGDFVYVVELDSKTDVSSVTMYDLSGNELSTVDEPTFYTATLSSPKIVAFKVPAVNGAIEKQYKLSIVANSGKTIEGAVYTTGYVMEALSDEGKFYEDRVEDNDGIADYEATFDYDFGMSA